MNILWVEDDYRAALDMSSQLREVFQPERVNTHIVHSFDQALASVGTTKYDAIIVDMVLPPTAEDAGIQIGGVELLRRLQEQTPRTKVVLYSRHIDVAQPETRRRIEGADFVFMKPSHSEVFGDDLAKALRDFIPVDKPNEVKPDSSIILPVRRSLVQVNNRLAERFRRTPALLRSIDPTAFEELVGELFEEDGYRVVLTPPRADGGKDLYVYKSGARLETCLVVECKRYVPPNKVGVGVARQLYGVMQQEHVSGGVIVTTSYFTAGARAFAGTVPYQLFLRDFDDLSHWLVEPSKNDGT